LLDTLMEIVWGTKTFVTGAQYSSYDTTMSRQQSFCSFCC